jgi:hypothetical protein
MNAKEGVNGYYEENKTLLRCLRAIRKGLLAIKNSQSFKAYC